MLRVALRSVGLQASGHFLVTSKFLQVAGDSDRMANMQGQQEIELDSDLEKILGTTRKSSHGGKTSKSLKVVFKKKNTVLSGKQHASDRPPVPSRLSGSSVAPVQTRSGGKRPMGETKIEMPELVPAMDPKRPRVTGEEVHFVDILNRGSVSVPEMFNLMFQYVPPPHLLGTCSARQLTMWESTLSAVAHSSVELFIRSRTADIEREEELKMLTEQVRKHEVVLKSWEQYPGSTQFHKDVVAYFANRPAALPDLVASACQSEEAALPLFHTLRRDPWGSRCSVERLLEAILGERKLCKCCCTRPWRRPCNLKLGRSYAPCYLKMWRRLARSPLPILLLVRLIPPLLLLGTRTLSR
nr:uncharacterized protein LOC109149872 [Ipomoea trifida]